MLAVLVPTILITGLGIVYLAIGSGRAIDVLVGVLVLTLCTSAITGYILTTVFVGKGASLARVQNDFLSSVSHELRTPLTAIGLFMDSLKDGRLNAEEQAQVVKLLAAEVARMDLLVVRLLELSKMEAGRHPFERTRVDVSDLVRDAIAAFDASTLAKPTKVAVDIEPGLAIVGDHPTLVRAVANLLVNAWKYTGDDKQIAVTARTVGRKVEIAVSDNGPGIERGERHDIFDEFTRGQAALDRGLPGVGLGLAFVRTIARAHKGKVVVSPRPAGGSIFKLRFKRRELAPA
jgi:two-component system phosphate regulon sensor histidine kinase PhoR